MATLPLCAADHGTRLHQINWVTRLWRRWWLQRARQSQRKALRDLADDPHLLADIGVTREEALEQAGKAFFDPTDVSIRSS